MNQGRSCRWPRSPPTSPRGCSTVGDRPRAGLPLPLSLSLSFSFVLPRGPRHHYCAGGTTGHHRPAEPSSNARPAPMGVAGRLLGLADGRHAVGPGPMRAPAQEKGRLGPLLLSLMPSTPSDARPVPVGVVGRLLGSARWQARCWAWTQFGSRTGEGHLGPDPSPPLSLPCLSPWRAVLARHGPAMPCRAGEPNFLSSAQHGYSIVPCQARLGSCRAVPVHGRHGSVSISRNRRPFSLSLVLFLFFSDRHRPSPALPFLLPVSY